MKPLCKSRTTRQIFMVHRPVRHPFSALAARGMQHNSRNKVVPPTRTSTDIDVYVAKCSSMSSLVCVRGGGHPYSIVARERKCILATGRVEMWTLLNLLDGQRCLVDLVEGRIVVQCILLMNGHVADGFGCLGKMYISRLSNDPQPQHKVH
jgi:hypothetical protein